MRTTVKWFLSALVALWAVFPASAAIDLVNDDTDLFMVNPNVSSQRPNVLLMLDNSANWNASSLGVTKRINEMNALTTALGDLTDQFNVGLMLFMESTGNPSSAENSAGYIRYGIRQMLGTVGDPTSNKGRLTDLLGSIKTSGNDDQSSSSFAYSVGMYETYLYFKGQTSTYGTAAAARDYTGNTNTRIASYISGLTDNPLTTSSSTTYRSPIVDACQKNFLIIISNGQDGSSASQVKGFNALNGIQPGTSEISPTTSVTFPDVAGADVSAVPASGVWTDEWARFMANNDCGPGTSTSIRPVFTYVIDVDPATNTTARRFSALLFNTAQEGKGKYFAVSNDGTALAAALKAIFQEIQAKNSVFASTTLPVSNNVRGTNLNQTYVGVFRPDGNRKPRWAGNVKMYKVGSNLDQLVDANTPAQPVFNSITGFVFNTAKSFWTTSSSYWAFRSPFETTDVGGASDSPDGDLVEKGGAAQRLRVGHPTNPQSSRTVYTCTGTCASTFSSPGTLLSATPFSNANVSAADLKAFTKVALSSLTSSGTTATAVTATAHGFTGTPSVVIDGASPSVYNGTYTVTVTGANSFTYTLASAPATNSARVITSTSHALLAGDTVTVTGAAQAGYNVTNAAVSNVASNSFEYPMSASETVAATGATIVAKRRLSNYGASISAPAGTATTATVYFPAHGYPVSTPPNVTIAGAGEAAFNVTNAAITVLDSARFTYMTSGTLTAAAGSTTVTATATAHGLGNVGDTVNNVTIAGASPAAYNGTYSVQIVSANTFSYVVGSTVAVNASGTMTASASTARTGSASAVNSNGNGRDDAVVTTSGNHLLGSTGSTVSVTMTGAGGTAPNSFYNGTFTATISGAGEFTYVMSCTPTGGGANCPAGGTAVSGMTYSATVATTKTVTSIVPTLPSVSATGGAIDLSHTVGNVTSVSVNSNADVSAATAGDPSAGNNTERDAIINWVRGQDNIDDENEDTIGTDVRAFIHGDVLHSRPAVVNYNRNGDDNDVYVFYGTNDGLFRAVKGGLASDGGDEAWSFVAPEFFGKLKRLRDNSPVISGAQPRDYFFDGSATVYTQDLNKDGRLVEADGDKVYLYLSMRRGGRLIYALDVSNPLTPRMMWKKGCPNLGNNTGCSAGWDEIGQTWSEPRLGYVRTNTNPVLIFGAGYDPAAEDFQPCLVTSSDDTSVTAYKGGSTTYLANGACWMSGGAAQTVNRSMGRGLFMVDAFTGAIVWRAGPVATRADRQVTAMAYAIPGDIALLNRDRDRSRTQVGTENVGDGYLDRLYAVDTGGNIWRFDIDHADKNFWVVNKLAALAGNTLDTKRKFLYSPRVTNDVAACGSFDMLVLGSGDREHPFFAGYYANPNANPGGATPTYLQDRYYMIKDPAIALVNKAGMLGSDPAKKSDMYMTAVVDSNLYDATSNCIQDCSLASDQATAKAALAAAKGWFINLANGEKTVTSSGVAGGFVEFATNQPKGNAGSLNCSSDLGLSRKYKVSACDATVSTLGVTLLPGQSYADLRVTDYTTGFPPSPTQATICIGTNCQTVTCFGPECHQPVSLKLNARKRVYWYNKSQP